MSRPPATGAKAQGIGGDPERRPAGQPPIDHVGWRLACALAAWKSRFTAEMVAGGFPWFGEARGALIQHIGRDGIAQADLAARAGMSKQAVQQHLDELVGDGIVERIPDPADARRKRIRFTALGHRALGRADAIKRAIEDDYRRRLGPEDAAALDRALETIARS